MSPKVFIRFRKFSIKSIFLSIIVKHYISISNLNLFQLYYRQNIKLVGVFNISLGKNYKRLRSIYQLSF